MLEKGGSGAIYLAEQRRQEFATTIYHFELALARQLQGLFLLQTKIPDTFRTGDFFTGDKNR
jgi:hypothetical protein